MNDTDLRWSRRLLLTSCRAGQTHATQYIIVIKHDVILATSMFICNNYDKITHICSSTSWLQSCVVDERVIQHRNWTSIIYTIKHMPFFSGVILPLLVGGRSISSRLLSKIQVKR